MPNGGYYLGVLSALGRHPAPLHGRMPTMEDRMKSGKIVLVYDIAEGADTEELRDILEHRGYAHLQLSVWMKSFRDWDTSQVESECDRLAKLLKLLKSSDVKRAHIFVADHHWDARKLVWNTASEGV